MFLRKLKIMNKTMKGGIIKDSNLPIKLNCGCSLCFSLAQQQQLLEAISKPQNSIYNIRS